MKMVYRGLPVSVLLIVVAVMQFLAIRAFV
jgi:hypothetical protein